jgi:hypothetical protein
MKFKLITAIDRINYFSDNFIAYYRKFFQPEEFYFLVHKRNAHQIIPYLTTHGFTKKEMEVYDISRFGWGENINKQNSVKKKFVDEGCTVLYADQDERIFHPDLRNYIINTPGDWIVPTGISLMQHSEEPPLDETKNILSQRSYGKLDIYWFSKTCILRKDFNWLPGRHTKPPKTPIDPNVYLVDVGKLCKDFMLKNNETSRKIYPTLFWRYSTNDKKDLLKVFEEHSGTLTLLPEIIKQSGLF